MSNQIPSHSIKPRLHRGRGLTPTEILIQSLCDGNKTREEIFTEVLTEIKNSTDDPKQEFDRCLEALKKRGLIIF